MPEDSKQMGARASNSPQLSIQSVRRAGTRLHDFLSRNDDDDDDYESRNVPLGYVSEHDGDLEIGLFGSEKSSDERN